MKKPGKEVKPTCGKIEQHVIEDQVTGRELQNYLAIYTSAPPPPPFYYPPPSGRKKKKVFCSSLRAFPVDKGAHPHLLDLRDSCHPRCGGVRCRFHLLTLRLLLLLLCESRRPLARKLGQGGLDSRYGRCHQFFWFNGCWVRGCRKAGSFGAAEDVAEGVGWHRGTRNRWRRRVGVLSFLLVMGRHRLLR